MVRFRHIRSLLLALHAAGCLRAGALEKAWEVDLRKALQDEHLARDQSFKVFSLSFSPDAQQIAVRLMDRAVLFQVKDPKTALGQFQSLIYHDSFGWSPDSRAIYSGGHVVHLEDRKACDLPPNALFPGFIGKGSLVALFLSAQHPSGAAQLKFYDADCQEQNSWEVPEGWLIMSTSPDRGLLSVWENGPHQAEHMIVDALTKRVLQSKSEAYGAAGWRWFADRAKAICGGKTCWDVDTARQIAQAPVSGSVSSASGVAVHASRVVLDDLHESGIPFSSTFTEMAARRRIWDFRSNHEVVSWQLKFLTYSTTVDGDGFNRDRKPIPCAISPDGEYVVEGGDGKIWLYKIHP